jgi:hypothetical protein
MTWFNCFSCTAADRFCRIVCLDTYPEHRKKSTNLPINSDSASFSGVQTFNPFLKQFGDFDEKKATWALPTRTVSLMNSLPLLGKFLGSIFVGPLIERFGHRTSMFGTCVCQIIGAVSEYSFEQSWEFRELMTAQFK